MSLLLMIVLYINILFFSSVFRMNVDEICVEAEFESGGKRIRLKNIIEYNLKDGKITFKISLNMSGRM